ncbi:pre-mRNA splicing regulator USH1G-like [Saccoglossus kowalevskii]|uniref:Usher syndrome type-1G protein homolog n=1 Tax=Saccoglossus kowalevskii TaxID=10224 RepID=A0ABM0GYV4_SACKO|nr:PREDICTED: Usher syndrome type-1G protein homolog [Saccoglossus kowalevskii]
MTFQFHQAAKDGYLDLLRDATKKDCNRVDEDGRTPTLYAAFYGNIDALRLIVSRGGDPDKCDLLGNTPLHFAAANGDLNCVTFLVSFGCNIWALDNDHRTPLDVAALRQRIEIVHALDSVAGKQSALNKKMVKRLKEKAILDADKRIKKYSKIVTKQEKQMQLEEKKLNKQQQKPYVKASGHSTAPPNMPYSAAMNKGRPGYIERRVEKKRHSNGTFGGFTQPVDDASKRSVRSTTNASVMMMSESSSARKPLTDDLFDSKVTHSNAVLQYGGTRDSGFQDLEDDLDSRKPARNGFGMMFLPSVASPVLLSNDVDGKQHLPMNDEDTLDDVIDIEHQVNTQGESTSLGTDAASTLPWDADDLDLEDDDDDVISSPLELFLAAHGLTDYLPLFTNEQIDLDSLMLCSDKDLKGINLPLGPRRKVLEAVARRKAVLSEPGPINDTVL